MRRFKAMLKIQLCLDKLAAHASGNEEDLEKVAEALEKIMSKEFGGLKAETLINK